MYSFHVYVDPRFDVMVWKGTFLCCLRVSTKREVFMSADIMASLCGVCVCVRMNNFSKNTRPRDMLLPLKDTLSIKGDHS